MMMALRWTDRVYGETAIDDAGLLDLIDSPTFRRLQRIRQAGPSALAFRFKTVTRHEHSLGVCVLLRHLGADRREQVAGLLHDISHTAFSHAVDFLFDSEEQDHHEGLKPEFLDRPDIAEALAAQGYAPADFYDDSIYPLLERPLPWLCADRLDYFFRDSLACRVATPEAIDRFLAHLAVVDRTIAFTSSVVAREAVGLFALMNRNWWAGPVEAYIYNEFADALREGLRLGVLSPTDLLADDDHVLDRLRNSGSPLIVEKLDHIVDFRLERTSDFAPRVSPKSRWLDPPVVVADGSVRRLTELS